MVQVILPTITRSTEVREYHTGCSLRYLLGFAQPEEPESHYHTTHASYFTLGTVIHGAVEDVLNYGTPLDDVVEKAQAELMEVIKKSDETVYTKSRPDATSTILAVEELITNWYTDVMPESDEQMGYYRALDFPPYAEQTLYVPDVEIESQIDAIFTFKPEAITNAGRTVIVDWKTGNSKKADDLQLWIYWYLLRKTGWVSPTEPFTGWFHHLTHREVQMAGPYPGDAYIEALIYKAHAYKTMRLWTPDKGWYCKYCPHYETVCPLYNDIEYGELMKGLDIKIVPGRLDDDE